MVYATTLALMNCGRAPRTVRIFFMCLFQYKSPATAAADRKVKAMPFVFMRAPHGRLLQMPLGVLPLVQDADNVQVVGVVQEIHHMRTAQVFHEIRQHFGRASVLCSSGQRMASSSVQTTR